MSADVQLRSLFFGRQLCCNVSNFICTITSITGGTRNFDRHFIIFLFTVIIVVTVLRPFEFVRVLVM